jgi:hypothetical protein
VILSLLAGCTSCHRSISFRDTDRAQISPKAELTYLYFVFGIAAYTNSRLSARPSAIQRRISIKITVAAPALFLAFVYNASGFPIDVLLITERSLAATELLPKMVCSKGIAGRPVYEGTSQSQPIETTGSQIIPKLSE